MMILVLLKRIIQKVYFFSFNKNVENYVESVKTIVETPLSLQEFYRIVIFFLKNEFST